MLDIKFKLMPGHMENRDWMEPSPLRSLFWNSTYACNLNCDICFTDSGLSSASELTTAEVMDFFNHARDIGVKNIILSGGEPFLRTDILGILSYLSKLDFDIRIASNGSLLDGEMLKRLKNETSTKSFQISLDTLDPHLYGKMHGISPDMLKKVLKTLDHIKKLGFHTTVSTRLTPYTIEGLPELLNRACDEEWATVTVHLPLLTARSRNAFPQDTDFLSLLEPAFNHFLRLKRRWLLEVYIPWAQYHPIAKFLENNIKVDYAGCRAGRDKLTVNPCGDISFCVCLDIPELYLGNIRNDRIEDVFNNSKICKMMREPDRYGICHGCSNLMTCGGGCRVAAYNLTGRIDGQDESCPVYKLIT